MGTIIAKGIDVSKHQGNIYWTVAKNSIDFAMIRAGYGTTVDENFGKNAKSCSLYGIPFGAYWFSYALSVEEAKEEAKRFLQTVANHNLTYPLAFDFECASYDYMVKNKITPTKELIIDIATAFLTEIEKAGYYAMIYANKDYVTKYFNTLREKYDLWYARWNVEVPDLACGMWQKGTASIAGISGLVDLDYSYKNYPEIIKKMKDNKNIENNLDEIIEATLEAVTEEFDKIKTEILFKRIREILSKYISME